MGLGHRKPTMYAFCAEEEDAWLHRNLIDYLNGLRRCLLILFRALSALLPSFLPLDRWLESPKLA